MPRNIRILYYGTPEFAVPALEKLLDYGYDVAAVVTATDKPGKRGSKPVPSPVKTFALERGVPVLQPSNLKSESFAKELKHYQPTLQVVVAFRMLPEVVWAFPPLGTFNLHAALLPNYRGAAPINWALINGETQTGATTFFLKHQIDTGDIILREPEPIHETDTAGTLYERLMHKGANLVLRTVQAIEADQVEVESQDMTVSAPAAPKLFKDNCQIDFSLTTEQVYNFVRGLAPYPAAWTTLDGKTLKLYRVSKDYDTPPSQARCQTDGKTYLRFRTADGWVNAEELQLPGKRRMTVEELLRGYQVRECDS